jgi:hypothetical protein
MNFFSYFCLSFTIFRSVCFGFWVLWTLFWLLLFLSLLLAYNLQGLTVVFFSRKRKNFCLIHVRKYIFWNRVFFECADCILSLSLSPFLCFLFNLQHPESALNHTKTIFVISILLLLGLLALPWRKWDLQIGTLPSFRVPDVSSQSAFPHKNLSSPNVDKLGRICLDILKDKWSPALQIRTVLLSIQVCCSFSFSLSLAPFTPFETNVSL